MLRLAAGECGWFGLVLGSLLLVPSLTQAEPQRFALVVGVKEYTASEKLNKLPYAEEDAAKLADVLGNIGYDVTLMTQKASEGENRRRFSPTATQVRKEFETLVKTPFLKKTDCLVVTLAGHGIQLPSKVNPKQTAYYFCPADARIDDLEFLEDVQPQHNLISVDEFYDTLQHCEAGVRLLVVDACRNDPNQPGAFRSSNSITRPLVPKPPGGIAALFSCSANERALEDANLKHGVFSHFLIEALSGQADVDKDGELTISEIQSYVGQRTFNFVRKNYGRQQMPELTGTIQGWAAIASLLPVRPAPLPIPAPTPVKPAPLPTSSPSPMPLPNRHKFAGTKAGELWDKNHLAMKFCWCPPGSFKMGSPTSEKDRSTDEEQVNVTISKGFWLGQYEVTQAEYESVAGENPSDFNREKLMTDSRRHPVEQVSWEAAMEFCKKLTAAERAAGRLPADWEYTLPTEAQWEYACRAGTTTATAFGDSLSNTQANIGDKQQTDVVGSYQANKWNLYDMHGNVWEWCRDWYADRLPGGIDPEVQRQAIHRAIRGGGWFKFGGSGRSSRRLGYTMTFAYKDLGFRLALVQIR